MIPVLAGKTLERASFPCEWGGFSLLWGLHQAMIRKHETPRIFEVELILGGLASQKKPP